MATVQLVTTPNLGKTIDQGVLEASKINVKVDGTSIKVKADGSLEAVGSSVVPETIVGHKIGTVTDSVTSTNIDLNETITKVVDAVNTLTITPEDGVAIVSTKINSVVNTLDAVAKTIVTTVNGVPSNAMDVTALLADINVDTVAWDQGTYVLTLTETDSTVHTLNLASLVAITSADSTSVAITGNGTTATPLTGAVKVSATVGNAVTVNADGLYVATPATETSITATDSTSIDFTVSGTANHTLTASVKFDPLVGNLAKDTGTGVLVDLADIKNLLVFDTQVQDVFGVDLGWMSSTNKFA